MTSSSSPDVLADQLKAIRDRELIPTPDEQLTDYAILTRCIEALGSSLKTAIPAPADGQVASQREASVERDALVRACGKRAAACRQQARHVVRSGRPGQLVEQIKYEIDHATVTVGLGDLMKFLAADQSSDVSGLVTALAEMLGEYGGDYNDECIRKDDRELDIIRRAREALAQAKRDGGAG